MSLMGHSRRFQALMGRSALPSDSDRIADMRGGPFRANNRHMQRSKNALLFDHLVGALLKKPRHVDAQRFRSFHIQNEFEPRR
jgi:hypothetical protein